MLDNACILAPHEYEKDMTCIPFPHNQLQPISPETAIKLIKLCPNLRTLKICLPAIDLRGKAGTRSQTNLENCVLKLISGLSGLIKLEIKNSEPLRMPEQSMSKIITQLPLLQSVYLNRLSTSPRVSSDNSLGLQLSGLSHLTELRLKDVDAVNLEWCQLKWSQSIKQLRLEGCRNLTPQDTCRLIKIMAPNIVHLRLCVFPGQLEMNPSWTGLRFQLPSLTDLIINTYGSFDKTVSFSDCQNLQRLKYLDASRFDWLALNELVPKPTWPHLKFIDVRSATPCSMGHADPQPFSDQCKNIGIQLYYKRSDKTMYRDWDSPGDFGSDSDSDAGSIGSEDSSDYDLDDYFNFNEIDSDDESILLDMPLIDTLPFLFG